jgi:glutathionylspermidine synthase
MKRFSITPRSNWQKTVESQGLIYHTTDEGKPYWDESAYYALSEREVDELERATMALNDMCLKAATHVIEGGFFDLLGIDARSAELVRQSWEQDELTIYGRFDLAYGTGGPPKLLEYNADTPTALLEAAVVQWYWMKDVRPSADQFNSIHERLLDAWKRFRAERGDEVWFASMESEVEDFMTVTYLRDTAIQAGLKTNYLDIEQIGHHAARRTFVDMTGRDMSDVFKLYPWEWMMSDQFADHIQVATTRWLEAPWKMALSNKAILAILWQLFPDSPYLLPAAFEPGAVGASYVQKPLHSREGANVRIVRDGNVAMETSGPYTGPSVYQRYTELPNFGGKRPVIGSWMVNGYACGIGIREDDGLVTGNRSRFVPHAME